MSEKASWGLRAGDELVPGRHIVRRLGGGVRYEVYLVADDTLWTSVVAKVLRPDRAQSERARAALRNEWRALGALAHPQIVRGFDAALEVDRPHVVLEHLEGPTLGRLIRRHGPVMLEQAIPMAVNLASALHYMAATGWVHLDVKPDNVVVSVTAKLVDLSASRTVREAEALTSSVGTPSYMSPEQCDPERYGPIGPPADVWALGATLYRAVSGERPFPRGEDPGERDPAPMPHRVPAYVAELIMASLERRPADRPTAAELATSFEPLVARLPSAPRLGRRRPRFA